MRLKTSAFVIPILAIAGGLVAQDLGRVIQSKPQAAMVRVEEPHGKPGRPPGTRIRVTTPQGE